MGSIKGAGAWAVIQGANVFNEPPSAGMQYVIVTIKAKNISSKAEPYSLWLDMDLALIGSSNRVYYTYDRLVILPDEGELSDFDAELYHGGEHVGSLAFYVPENETDLILVESFFLEEYKVYYEVR